MAKTKLVWKRVNNNRVKAITDNSFYDIQVVGSGEIKLKALIRRPNKASIESLTGGYASIADAKLRAGGLEDEK